MAEIEVRTPEDLDKVFTDIFALLNFIGGRLRNIEDEIIRLKSPIIRTTPSIHGNWGSSLSSIPGKISLVKQDDLAKRLYGGEDGEEKDNSF